jgi:hypothetical protein
MDQQSLRKEIVRRLSDEDELLNSVRKAVREAVREHQRAGNPVAEWRDGRVVLIPPEEIRLDDGAGEEKSAA